MNEEDSIPLTPIPKINPNNFNTYVDNYFDSHFNTYITGLTVADILAIFDLLIPFQTSSGDLFPGSRVAGAIYQNTNALPKYVIIEILNVAPDALVLVMDIETPPGGTDMIAVGFPTGGTYGHTLIVPPGWYYQVEDSGGGASVILKWFEID